MYYIERFEYRKATMKDVDELVRTRIIVLCVANKLPDDVDMSPVEKESYACYKRGLKRGEQSMLHIWYMITESLLVQTDNHMRLYQKLCAGVNSGFGVLGLEKRNFEIHFTFFNV